MLKRYRRNFIALNMITVGIVLIVTFVFIGIMVSRDDYDELKNVMQMVVKPWNEAEKIKNDTPRDDKKQPRKPDGKTDNKEHRPQPERETERYKDDNITTLFYDKSTDKISVLSEEIVYNGDLYAPVSEITERKDNFGILEKYHLIYYKERTSNDYKIAITDTWYLESGILRVTLILSAAFIMSMMLMFFISRRLSNLAAKPMEDAISRERQFVADISHDLKTPITVILANNSILKANPETTVYENLQWIDSTDTAGRDMMVLVNEMLTLSKLESEDKCGKKEKTDLSSAAEKTVLQLESVAYERGIVIEADIEEAVTVLAVQEHLKRICSCLIENAVKYEPDGGKIGVKLYRSKKSAIMEVKNYGSVIAADDLPHIFDRFYRGDKTRTTKGGHGLGLPIIKRMAELSGAEIRVESSAAAGTVFTVEFEAYKGDG